MDYGHGHRKKRDRAVNFAISETICLVEICLQFIPVIENKKTDSVTNKQKETAWREITRIFNKRSGAAFRNEKTLKLKYDGLKKLTKKKIALNRQLYENDGEAEDQIPYTPIEKKIIKMLSDAGKLEESRSRIEAEGDELGDALSEDEEESISFKNMNEITETNTLSEPFESEPENGSYVVKEEIEDEEFTTTEICNGKVEEILSKNDDLSSQKETAFSSLRKNPKFPRNENYNKSTALRDARIELVKMQIELAKNELKQKQAEHEAVMRQHEAKLQYFQKEDERRQIEHEMRIKNRLLLVKQEVEDDS